MLRDTMLVIDLKPHWRLTRQFISDLCSYRTEIGKNGMCIQALRTCRFI